MATERTLVTQSQYFVIAKLGKETKFAGVIFANNTVDAQAQVQEKVGSIGVLTIDVRSI